jgi:hypothetical protein
MEDNKTFKRCRNVIQRHYCLCGTEDRSEKDCAEFDGEARKKMMPAEAVGCGSQGSGI